MKPSVYIETSIIGYLTARVSKLLVAASNQQVTREWWDDHRQEFDLFVSQFVVDECSSGDKQAASERMELLAGIPWLEINDKVRMLADSLMTEVPLPAKAKVDSIHVAVSAVNGVKFLLTWNCKHIANPSFRPKIEHVCRESGFEPPIICTPQELLEM